MLIEPVLTHELQLGEQLNHSVQQQRRADFALMLAMLTDDVTEHSQFHLPITEGSEPAHDDSYYRRLFAVPEPAPLAIAQAEQYRLFNQAEHVQQQHLCYIHLLQALKANPLAQRDDQKFIDANILANTSAHCQARYRQRNNSESVSKASHSAFNAIDWLHNIKQSQRAQHSTVP